MTTTQNKDVKRKINRQIIETIQACSISSRVRHTTSVPKLQSE